MSRKQKDILLLKLSVGAFFAMSISFLLMPIEAVSVLAGAVFWLGLSIGLILQVVLEKRRKAFFAEYHVRPQQMQKPRNGLLTFGASKMAKIADYVLLFSGISLILSMWLTRGTSYLCYLLIALTVFSLCMHCVLNGRIYFHVINQTKIQRALEKKKDRTIRKERDHNVS